MAMVFFLFILMLGLSWSQAAADTAVRRLVLAAGANNGGVDRDLLRYAVSDAENFVRVLEEMGGLDSADVLLLRDPDLADFEQGLHELSRRVTAANRRGDRLEVLLYYSGHADEEGLLLAGEHRQFSNADQNRNRSSARPAHFRLAHAFLVRGQFVVVWRGFGESSMGRWQSPLG